MYELTGGARDTILLSCLSTMTGSSQTAENMFAPVSDEEDSSAEVIGKSKVGGLLQFKDATVIGLCPE